MAVATGIVGNARVGAVLAALDMTAQRRGAADLDRGHDAPLGEAQMRLIDGAPSGAVAAEDIRHFELWTRHCRRVNPARSPPGLAVRAGSGLAGSGRWQHGHRPESS